MKIVLCDQWWTCEGKRLKCSKSEFVAMSTLSNCVLTFADKLRSRASIDRRYAFVRCVGGTMDTCPIAGNCQLQFPPLPPSRRTPSGVMPTTEIKAVSTGFGERMKMELQGLSTMWAPTSGRLWRHGMPSFASSPHGPTPLNRRSWGLPKAPAERMTSLQASPWRRTVCVSPFQSRYSTPTARGDAVGSTIKT